MQYCPNCAAELTSAVQAGRLRLKCSAPGCDYVFWDNPIPTVAAVVELDGEVILVRQKGWPEKWLGLVSGFLEKGETPEQGILREVHEELGLQGEIVRFIGVYSFFLRNQLILAYHVRGRGEITLGDELESCKRLPPERVRPWELGTGPALRDWLAGQTKPGAASQP
jgi:NADH pyrophosphatase NudC (nudix superfamily)